MHRHGTSEPTVHLPFRAVVPRKVEVFLGPTNSGKTHQALQHLAQCGEGVYAAPLRMLAWEAYDLLSRQRGASQVGLITGEEQVNAQAPILCCTAETAPLRSKLLVLDEVQWAADPDRGWAWSRLLAGSIVEELYVTGEIGALPLIRAALGDSASLRVPDRLGPLEAAGSVTLADIPPHAVVIAFSRRAVLHLAGLLRAGGRHVSVLYGALPPEVRRAQIRYFISGVTDIVVATDVIGHGINLPVDTVVFAETQKFDGIIRRPIAPWEAAQIGGRAGRFRLAEQGTIRWLTGVPGFNCDPLIIHSIFTPRKTVEGHPAYRLVTQGYVAPSFSDMGAAQANDLPASLNKWAQLATTLLPSAPWAKVQPVAPMVSRLSLLSQHTIDTQNLLSLLASDDAWQLAHAPLDANDPVDGHILLSLGQQLAGTERLEWTEWLAKPDIRQDAAGLELLARKLVGLRWATLTFAGRLGISHGDVSRALDQVASVLNTALTRAIKNGVAHCVSCGELCAPWFHECDACHWGTDWWENGAEDDDDGMEEFLTVAHGNRRRVPSEARLKRTQHYDSIIEDAVQEDAAFARPHSFPRSVWALHVLPLLRAQPAHMRDALKTLIIQNVSNRCTVEESILALRELAESTGLFTE